MFFRCPTDATVPLAGMEFIAGQNQMPVTLRILENFVALELVYRRLVRYLGTLAFVMRYERTKLFKICMNEFIDIIKIDDKEL